MRAPYWPFERRNSFRWNWMAFRLMLRDTFGFSADEGRSMALYRVLVLEDRLGRECIYRVVP